MKELEFPLDLHCSCIQIFLEAERLFFGNLSRKDVNNKLLSASKMKTLEAFLNSYAIDPLKVVVDLEIIEGMIIQHEIHLAKKYMDGGKLIRMANFLEIFENAKESIPLNGRKSQSLPPFSKVTLGSSFPFHSHFISAFSSSQNLLPKPLPTLLFPPLPLPDGKETHCFLTHNWANNNHEKVKRINEALKRRGLITWFDSEKMKDQIRHVMTKALTKTCSVVIFLTKIYETKINKGDELDNCYFEFNGASTNRFLVNNRIAAATEKQMINPTTWEIGRLSTELGSYLIVDVSEEDDETIFEKQVDDLASRIKEKITNQLG